MSQRSLVWQLPALWDWMFPDAVGREGDRMCASVIHWGFALGEVTGAVRNWVGRRKSQPGKFYRHFYLSLLEAGELNLQASSLITTGPWQNLHLGSKVGRFKYPGKFWGLWIILQSEGMASSGRKQATVGRWGAEVGRAAHGRDKGCFYKLCEGH